MNRNQRRLGRLHQKLNFDFVHRRARNSKFAEIEEVLPPRHKREAAKCNAFTLSKSCYVSSSQEEIVQNEICTNKEKHDKQTHCQHESKIHKLNTTKASHFSPDQEDFAQATDIEFTQKYQKIVKFDPLSPNMPKTMNQHSGLKNELYSGVLKVDNGSQRDPVQRQYSDVYSDILGSAKWQQIDSINEVDDCISKGKCNVESEPIHISQIPRVKILAKKFSCYKKDNVELRRLEERVVCVEYDVFVGDSEKPREKLRAFFCIKSFKRCDGKETITIPSDVKRNFELTNEDLNKLSVKEIEIIDGKIQENKPYLEDLKRILKRNQAIYTKKNKASLDLMSLYEMAKRQSTWEDNFSNPNILSISELQEIKELILRKCSSTLHGINRRTVKKDSKNEVLNNGVVSQSIVDELLRGQH